MTDTVYTIEANKNGEISPADKILLRQAYNDVYLVAFTIPEEQISFKALCSNVENGATVTLILAPRTAAQKHTIKAMAVGYHYHGDTNHPDVSLLGYLATDPQYQAQGLGRKMDALFRQTALEQAEKRGKTLGGIFVECNPVGTLNDVMDPAVRIAMYKKWGAIELPIFYKQPPLELGSAGLVLRLLVEPNPKTGEYPAVEDIKTYLTGIYTESRKNLEEALLNGVENSKEKAAKLREEAKQSSEEVAHKLNKRAANFDARAAKMKVQAEQLPTVEKNPDYQRSMQDLAKFDNKKLSAFYKDQLAQKPPQTPPSKPKGPGL